MTLPILLVALLSFAALIGDVAYGASGMKAAIALSLSLLIVGVSLPVSLIMRLRGAVPISPRREFELRQIVERLAARAAIKTPRLFLLSSAEASAITVGRGDSDSGLAVTRGLLRLLDREELEAVIAHEIAHLRNNDANLQRLAAVVGMVAIVLLRLGTAMTFLIVFAAGSAAASKAAQLALLSIATPVVISLLITVLLRTRELAADATAMALTANPGVLASGLRKLSQCQNCWLQALLGTTKPSGPPLHCTTERLRRLEELQGEEVAGWADAASPLMVEPISRL